MRAFGITMGVATMLAALTACGAVGVQSGSQSTTVDAANTASTSTTEKSTGIADRDGSRQIRDCLHCAP